MSRHSLEGHRAQSGGRVHAAGSRAVGALSAGAIALGALALGALAIGRLAVGRARIQRLEIGELEVGQLRVSQTREMLSNYLFFTTTCEEALSFYAKCGLGKVTTMVRHGDNGMPVSNEAMRGKVMHSRFEGPGVLFYASDNDDAEPMRGSAMIFMLTDAGETRRLFERMSAGGNITTALAIQPWGDYFGKLTDRFGVQWMFNCAARP